MMDPNEGKQEREGRRKTKLKEQRKVEKLEQKKTHH